MKITYKKIKKIKQMLPLMKKMKCLDSKREKERLELIKKGEEILKNY